MKRSRSEGSRSLGWVLALGFSLGAGTLFAETPGQERRVARAELDKSKIEFDDGDTILYGGEELRLLGFDTPETIHPQHGIHENQPYGRRASALAKRLIREAKKVEVVADGRRDKYGRALAHLLLDGKLLAVKMIRAGLAYETVSRWGGDGYPEYEQQILKAWGSLKKADRPKFIDPHDWRQQHQIRSPDAPKKKAGPVGKPAEPSGTPVAGGQPIDPELLRAGMDRAWELLRRRHLDETRSESWLNRKSALSDPDHPWFKRTAEIEAVALKPKSCPAKTEFPTEAVVENVMDGDTLSIKGVGTVRLEGVDTTEKMDPRKPVQFLAEEGSAVARELASGKKVRLEYGEEIYDKYCRVLAFVYLPDGRMLNAELIRVGLAFAYTRYPFPYEKEFLALERKARAKGLGLWKGGGMAEYQWLRAQGRLEDLESQDYGTFEMSGSRWGIQHKDRVLLGLTSDEATLELLHLRKDIHFLGPMDLDRELLGRGYMRVEPGTS